MRSEYLDYYRHRSDYLRTATEQKRLKALRAAVNYRGLKLFGEFYRICNGGDNNEKYETK